MLGSFVSELDERVGRALHMSYTVIPSLRRIFREKPINMKAKQQPTCTKGPYSEAQCRYLRKSKLPRSTSFPSDKPDATESARPSPLMRSVIGLRKASNT